MAGRIGLSTRLRNCSDEPFLGDEHRRHLVDPGQDQGHVFHGLVGRVSRDRVQRSRTLENDHGPDRLLLIGVVLGQQVPAFHEARVASGDDVAARGQAANERPNGLGSLACDRLVAPLLDVRRPNLHRGPDDIVSVRVLYAHEDQAVFLPLLGFDREVLPELRTWRHDQVRPLRIDGYDSVADHGQFPAAIGQLEQILAPVVGHRRYRLVAGTSAPADRFDPGPRLDQPGDDRHGCGLTLEVDVAADGGRGGDLPGHEAGRSEGSKLDGRHVSLDGPAVDLQVQQ